MTDKREGGDPFKAGDEVYIDTFREISKATISRVTKTQVIIEYDHYQRRFRLDTGRAVGEDRHNLAAHPPPGRAARSQVAQASGR